jgi:hypothetical protein
MTQRKSFEEILERKNVTRMAREEKAAAKLEKREAQAERLVGTLSSGRFYVYPVGGHYKEFKSTREAVAYLIQKGIV